VVLHGSSSSSSKTQPNGIQVKDLGRVAVDCMDDMNVSNSHRRRSSSSTAMPGERMMMLIEAVQQQ
jgi:hypothetical protein